MCYRIVLRPEVPRDPDKFREWLAAWHTEHNGTTPGDKRPGYVLTERGRQLLQLSIGGKN